MDFCFRDGRPFRLPSVFHLFFFPREKAYVICLDRQFPSIFTFFTFRICAIILYFPEEFRKKKKQQKNQCQLSLKYNNDLER